MSVLAWLGIWGVVLGIYLSGNQIVDRFSLFESPNQIIEGVAFAWFVISCVILTLLGGLISKPRYLWPVLVVIGIIYCIYALIDILFEYLFPERIPILLKWCLLPGIICVLEGLFIRWFRKRQNPESGRQV
jgi:hypothetical protein